MTIDKELHFIAKAILAVRWEKFDSKSEKQGWKRKKPEGGYEYRYQESDPNKKQQAQGDTSDWSSRVSNAWSKLILAKKESDSLDAQEDALHYEYQETLEDKDYEAWKSFRSSHYEERDDLDKNIAMFSREVNREMADGPSDLSYSKNNPHQTEKFIFHRGEPLVLADMKSGAIDDWILTGENQIILNKFAGEFYGRDPFDDWKRIIAETVKALDFGDDLTLSDAPREIYDAWKRVVDDVNDGDADEDVLKAVRENNISSVKPKLLGMLAKKAIERVTEALGKRLEDALDPNFVNHEAMKNIFLSLKKEAEESLPEKPVKVFRGLTMSEARKRYIMKEIEENGYYDLPVPPVQSYTRSERIADQFAKYGQGGEMGRDYTKAGCVITSSLTKENVWMHDRQPAWAEQMRLEKEKGFTFNIGGTDQKEVLVGHPQKTVRLTKENLKWI